MWGRSGRFDQFLFFICFVSVIFGSGRFRMWGRSGRFDQIQYLHRE